MVVGLGHGVCIERVDGSVQLLHRSRECAAGVAESAGQLLPAHPAATLPVVADDLAAAPADRPGRDRGCLDHPTIVVTSKPKQAQGTSTLTSHMGGLLRCSVVRFVPFIR